ncbi:hypothetical protein C8Q79DRAFT_923482 [Trametes meyenii]|nr:hypothetical protein C8Q79DRAFT_923482 [Trametes meyenii]
MASVRTAHEKVDVPLQVYGTTRCIRSSWTCSPVVFELHEATAAPDISHSNLKRIMPRETVVIQGLQALRNVIGDYPDEYFTMSNEVLKVRNVALDQEKKVRLAFDKAGYSRTNPTRLIYKIQILESNKALCSALHVYVIKPSTSSPTTNRECVVAGIDALLANENIFTVDINADSS